MLISSDMFYLSGINNSLRNQKLKPVKQETSLPSYDFNKQEENSSKYLKLFSIQNKVNCGSYLSFNDLNYLRENDPELYKKACYMSKKRSDYQNKLSSCKTKQEAFTVRNEILADAGNAIASPNNANVPVSVSGVYGMNGFISAVESDWHYYQSSQKYSKLPNKKDDDLLNQKRKTIINTKI